MKVKEHKDWEDLMSYMRWLMRKHTRSDTFNYLFIRGFSFTYLIDEQT